MTTLDSFTCRLVQWETSLGPPDDGTLDAMSETIRAAGSDQVDLVIFPELVTTGYHVFDRLADDAEPIPGPTTDRLGRVAADADVHVLFGMPGRTDTGYQNAAVWLDRDGAVRAAHVKRHRWGAERDAFEPGPGPTVVETDFGTFGLQICYEANFPEASADLARTGVDAIINISAWSVTMEPDWHTLLPARALENGAYLLGCNLVGDEESTTFCGHSKAINPDGTVQTELDETAGTLTVTLERDRLRTERDRNPMRHDREQLAADGREEQTD
ncbi:carbon-nitrogen hydrolase family protein [Halospeciosus flavus]|uniref:Carbon-nitrogen hydrolase family protein n=1 Tax=Halospeciosus flavus TaxID=3032283 RepID=A0ABD5Z3H2_9EURY|nr:carbon-nitrogen hydrolase family protein [Halospeciosus flavus]